LDWGLGKFIYQKYFIMKKKFAWNNFKNIYLFLHIKMDSKNISYNLDGLFEKSSGQQNNSDLESIYEKSEYVSLSKYIVIKINYR